MKGIIRTIAIYTGSLVLLPYIIPGVRIDGNWLTFLFAGIILALLYTLLKPILKIISFPLNIATFGLFSLVINVVIFYLLTVFVPQITIHSFVFSGVSYAGFSIPKIAVNEFFSYILAALCILLITSGIKWILDY